MANFWISTFSNPLSTGVGADYGTGISVDYLGNSYISGYSHNGTDFDAIVAKYDTGGGVSWQRRIAGSTGNDYAYATGCDSSGNCYVTGNFLASTDMYQFVAKFNSIGTIQWQRALDGVTTNPDSGSGIAADSSGNSYVVGYTNNATNDDFSIVKYNSSGVIQWQRKLTYAANDRGYGVAVDTSGNVYVTGVSYSGTSDDIVTAKYDTNGNIQWKRTLAGISSDTGRGIALDPSGNVYIVGYTVAADYDVIIAKYNNSGVIQWQRKLTGASNEYGYGISVDSSGNSYITGTTYNGANTDSFIAKYDTNGNIQWQRKLSRSSADTISNGISTDLRGNCYICGTTYNGVDTDIFVAKLPYDGSGVGTYLPFSYSANTLNDYAATLTDSAAVTNDFVSTMTDSAGSLTIYNVYDVTPRTGP